MKNTQNRWTAEEVAKLKKNIGIYPNREDAFRKTAEQTGRSASACSYQFYNRKELKETYQNDIGQSSKSQRVPQITYHNGTTRKADVIVNEKGILVAKMDDVVITVRF